MIYPKELKKGDYIGVTAPSLGVEGQRNSKRTDNAIKNLEQRGFKIKETSNVRTNYRGRSSSAKQRAKEFLDLWEDKEVTSIICLEGGDFQCEMLDEMDFERIKLGTPKWVQGYSDVTNLGYVITTNLDIATIYGPNFKSYGMRNLHISQENALKLMEKEEFMQNSYSKCEEFLGWDTDSEEVEDPYEEYTLTKDVKWINLNGESKIEFSGRCIGGCYDVIKNIIGTRFDKVKEYIEKYKNDGIVWFFDIFETSTPGLFTTLWQFKNAGYFEHCKGIIFGRPLMVREDYHISYGEMIKDVIGDLNIPIIIDCDIGHIAPQIPIVDGAILEVVSENGRGSIRNLFQ